MTPEIINGDCLDILPSLDPVHLVLTDPPYAFDKMGKGWTATTERPTTHGQTVKNLAAGMAFKPDQARKARVEFSPYATAISKAMLPGAFALVFAAPRLSHGFADALEDGGLAIRDLLFWEHNEGQFKAANLVRFDVPAEQRVPMPRPMGECIILAQKLPSCGLAKNWLRHRTGLMRERTLSGGIPSSVFHCPKPDQAERMAGGNHPTPKPIALLRELIYLFSLPGQTVLDPFAGSGSTGVAAISLDRNFVGIEIDPAFGDRKSCI